MARFKKLMAADMIDNDTKDIGALCGEVEEIDPYLLERHDPDVPVYRQYSDALADCATPVLVKEIAKEILKDRK